MHTTNVMMRINMGLEDQILSRDEAQTQFDELKSHISDILPTLDDLDHLDDADHIKGVSLKNLEIGNFGLYNIQFTMTIQHDVPLGSKTIQEITEIMFEHGANSPITFDELPNYFLYPYESRRMDNSDSESDSSL
jgi:hypothetical protein